jgi:hypothetical protein
MTSTTLPNHYEMLGLTPAASEEEIARAFARQMSLFRAWPMAAAAQMSIAYETLRHPAKRRDYDASIGLPPPEPPRSPRAVTGHMHFIPAAPAVERTMLEPAPAPAKSRRVDTEARTAAAIAASLREPEARSQPRPEPRIPEFLELPRDAQPLREEPVRHAWRRPAMVMAALVGGVGLIGAWAGSVAGTDAQEEQVTVPVPKARTQPASVAPPVTQSPVVAEAEHDTPIALAAIRTKRPDPPRQAAASPDRLSDVSRSLHRYYETTAPDGTNEIAVAPSAAEAEAASPEAVPAKMPLSNATIARTIGRIGYACGEVASTNAVEGASGVFKVTCTSGHSYQAKPVHGRYRFRRLD